MSFHPPYAQVHTASDLRRTADALGSFFFSPSTMQFFSSRLLSPLFPVVTETANGDARGYFVTSERYGDDAPRRYAVRRYEITRDREARFRFDAETIGERYDNARAAKREAERLANTERYASNTADAAGEVR